LEFNGTFSTVRLYRAFRSYSLHFGKQKHPGSRTSPIQQWMTSDINNTLVSHCFLFTMALKGMEPARNPQ